MYGRMSLLQCLSFLEKSDQQVAAFSSASIPNGKVGCTMGARDMCLQSEDCSVLPHEPVCIQFVLLT